MATSTKSSLLALAGLAVLAALVLARFTVGGEALLGVDLLARSPPYSREGPAAKNVLLADPVWCTFPREASVGRALHEGRGAPRWEPGLGAGEPTALVNATAPDYPPWRLAFALLPAWRAHGALVVLHLALALAGAFLLARARGASARAALVASLVYGLSGHLSVWLELDLWTIAAAWIPWALLGLEVRGARGIVLASAAIGASILGGHLQVAAFGCLLALVWNPRRAAVALALGLALGAPRLLPAAVELRESARERIPFERYFKETGSLTPARLQLLVAPDRDDPVGHVQLAREPSEVQANAQELRFAPGAVALALALAAATRRKNAKLALLAGSVLLLAMPTPLAWPLWRFAPGFGSTTPTRILSLFPLLAGLLAAEGFESFAREPRRAAVALGVVALALVALAVQGGAGRPILKPLGLALAGIAGALLADGSSRSWAKIGAAVLLAAIAFDLAESTVRWNPSGPPSLLYPETPLVERARELQRDGRVLADRHVQPDLLLPVGLRNTGSYGSSHPRRFARLVDLLGGVPARQWLYAWRLPEPWRDALSVRAVLAVPRPTVAEGLALVASSDAALFENPTALPRARVFPVRAAHLVAGEEEALALARKIDPRRELVIEGVPHEGAPCEPTAAEILLDGPELVKIHARATEASYLVLMDTWASGWSATVDGVESAVLHADVAFRAVRIEAGDHDVDLSFTAPLRGPGLLVAGAALVAMLLLGTVNAVRNRRFVTVS